MGDNNAKACVNAQSSFFNIIKILLMTHISYTIDWIVNDMEVFS